jgi:hypothetical protein
MMRAMEALQRASAFVFYVLGVLTILLIVLVQRGIVGGFFVTLLSLLDLPLLFSGMLFGGSSLYRSFTREKSSPFLAIVIFLPLAALFCVFAYFNFALPFAEV